MTTSKNASVIEAFEKDREEHSEPEGGLMMEEFVNDQLGNLVNELLDRGFNAPLHFAALAPSGATIEGKFEWADDQTALDMMITGVPEQPLLEPMHILFVDADGRAERFPIEPSGFERLHKIILQQARLRNHKVTLH